jgi:hypothetical protein
MSEESRRMAEALGPDRDRRAREARERAERRERIATAIYAAVIGGSECHWVAREENARDAVLAADALLAELDRRRDAELQEARDA